jgi:16S rRNA processing protein RimM
MGDLIATGVIRGSHGMDGYVKVTSFSGDLEHFCSLKEVTLVSGNERIETKIDDVRVAHDRVLVKFMDVDTIEAARSLTSWEIWVTRNTATPLAAEEHYIADLVGCNVLLDGKRVGTVRGVVDSAADALFEIVMADGATRFVPYRDEFVGEVDVPNATIQLTAAWSIE